MNATTVAVDLAKSVFQLAVADSQWRVVETHRLTRTQFERWFLNRDASLVVMEACGSAHHWARYLLGLGIEVKLLPAKYVRAYVKRNKTDAADAAALLEAARASDITPVRVKSVEQQALRGRAATVAQRAGREVDGLKDWALKVQGRTNHNKAACALANKLARICYAVLKYHEPYGTPTRREENKKMNRTAYAVAA